jgi:hypothetical protein
VVLVVDDFFVIPFHSKSPRAHHHIVGLVVVVVEGVRCFYENLGYGCILKRPGRAEHLKCFVCNSKNFRSAAEHFTINFEFLSEHQIQDQSRFVRNSNFFRGPKYSQLELFCLQRRNFRCAPKQQHLEFQFIDDYCKRVSAKM